MLQLSCPSASVRSLTRIDILLEASMEAVLEYTREEVRSAIAVRLEGVRSDSGPAHGACPLPLQPFTNALVAKDMVA